MKERDNLDQALEELEIQLDHSIRMAGYRNEMDSLVVAAREKYAQALDKYVTACGLPEELVVPLAAVLYHSFLDVKTYAELTVTERGILTPMQFKSLRAWAK